MCRRGDGVSQRLFLICRHSCITNRLIASTQLSGICCCSCVYPTVKSARMQSMASRAVFTVTSALCAIVLLAPQTLAISALPDGVVCSGGEFLIGSACISAFALSCGVVALRNRTQQRAPCAGFEIKNERLVGVGSCECEIGFYSTGSLISEDVAAIKCSKCGPGRCDQTAQELLCISSFVCAAATVRSEE